MRPPTTLEIARAIRRAAEENGAPRSERPWSVRIHTGEAVHAATFPSQVQVCRLTADLQRLGLQLELEPAEDADFVFAPMADVVLDPR